jgi:hypothetical protein
MIKYVYYVPFFKKILLLINSIIKHSPQLDIDFNNNNRFLIVNKNRKKKTVSMGVEEQCLFRLIKINNA